MPIFESDDNMTEKDFMRQQLALNNKIFRLESKRFMESLESHQNGDCWENEKD